MKLLLIGSAGQLGQALQEEKPAGADLQAVTRADVDLSDGDALRELIRAAAPDVIINAAAYTAVDKAENDEAAALAVNADAVLHMAQSAEQTGCRLVHVSTDFVFDGRSARAYAPADVPSPLSVYGSSKAKGEQHVDSSDLIVRTSWVYSAGNANFVTTMLRLMNDRDEIGIVSDQIGAPTWATGLARTIWELIARGASGIYHHCDAGVASWYDFAVAIAEEASYVGLLEKVPAIRPISTSDYPTPAARPAFSLLDCSATLALTENEPTHWRVNLRKMLKEEQALG